MNKGKERIVKIFLQGLEDKTCVICSEDMDEPSEVELTDCGHAFHSSCISEVKKNGNMYYILCYNVNQFFRMDDDKDNYRELLRYQFGE